MKVAADIDDAGGGKLAALFRPARSLPAVSRISFEGNKAVPGSVLRMAVATAGIGTPYTERRFREILDASVRPVYEARGLMRVTFPKIRAEEDSEVKGVHVTVTVDEGEVYTLTGVSMAKPLPLPEAELLRVADIKTGGVANFDVIAPALERLREEVRRAGYLDAKTSVDRQFDDAKRTAALVFRIDAGSRYTMRKLAIEGLALDGEAAIRKRWALKTGEPFNPEYPDRFLQTVREDGMFDHLGKTRAETKIDATAAAVDVTLRFAAEDAAGKQKDASRMPPRRKL